MRGNARYDGATVTQGKWQTDVEAYIATLAALNGLGAVYVAILRNAAVALDRFPEVDHDWKLTPDVPLGAAVDLLTDHCQLAVDAWAQSEGAEVASASAKVQAAHWQRIRDVNEEYRLALADAYTPEVEEEAGAANHKAFEEAWADFDASGAMVDALDDPAPFDPMIDRLTGDD
jgi:hypothetical protein